MERPRPQEPNWTPQQRQSFDAHKALRPQTATWIEDCIKKIGNPHDYTHEEVALADRALKAWLLMPEPPKRSDIPILERTDIANEGFRGTLFKRNETPDSKTDPSR